jgi:hypothetical protein
VSPKLAAVVGAIIVVAAGVAAAEVIETSREKTSAVDEPKTALAPRHRHHHHHRQPISHHHTSTLPPASAGVQPSSGGGEILEPRAERSWAELSGSVAGEVAVAVAPLGGDSDPIVLGSPPTGHAWSSIKVPIVATLLQQQGETLDGEEEAQARAALTASDNEAAASLFARLESRDGGLEAASVAVGTLLGEHSREQTTVATAPPPPGAFSRYGQTEWSLAAAAEFHAALGAGCVLGHSGTEEVLGLMEEVIPEQRWGLGEADFPPEWSLAFKAGWGPEGSASGPYLVRQNGILRDGNRGVAVAMLASDESGSFEAGVQDLNLIGSWLRENLRSPLPRAGNC